MRFITLKKAMRRGDKKRQCPINERVPAVFRLCVAMLITAALPALAANAAAPPPLAANAAAPLPLEAVADGDYAHFGQIAITTPLNAGDIANLGIIVGRDAVAVVDTGGSVEVGRQLLSAVRALTDKPIR